jgi:hypothetical protein
MQVKGSVSGRDDRGHVGCVPLESIASECTHKVISEPTARLASASRKAFMWYIHYKMRGVAGVHSANERELAIAKAYDLLDLGAEISGIEHKKGLEGITIETVRLLCAERKLGRD